MDQNNQSLSHLLKTYVKQQIEKNSLLSESQISQKLDIPIATFHRILNERGKPSLQTLIKLSKYIPEIKDFIPKEMFEVMLQKTSSESLGKRLETLLLDCDLFLIYALAFTEEGITEDYIVKNFGSKKIEKLRRLENEGFVKREGNGIGRYKVTKERQFTSNFEVIKKHIDILNEFYKPEAAERNYAFYGVDRLNRKGMRELMQVNKEYHEKAVEVMNKKENKGDISVFCTGVSDILFEESLNERED